MTTYRVFPDYTADPVWAHDGMVDLDELPITDDLRDRLRQWNADWEELVGARTERFTIIDKDGHRRWIDEGRNLAHRLQRELGPGVEISYEP